MAAVEKAEVAVPAVPAAPGSIEIHIEQILQKHQQELLQHLDSWANHVTNVLTPPSLAKAKSTLGVCNLPEVEDVAPKKKRKSYDEARATHEQAMEARTEAEFSRGLSEVKPFWHSWRHFRKWTKSLMESTGANAFFALLILSNSVFLGVQLEMQTASQDVGIQLTLFTALNVTYAILFSLEVALRLLAWGPGSYLWLSEDVAWNYLDIFVVFASWIELIIFFLTPGSNMGTNRNFRVLRLLRFGRIVRVVRIVRVARLFRSLRTLINSLAGTLKSLFWSLLLLALIMYMLLGIMGFFGFYSSRTNSILELFLSLPLSVSLSLSLPLSHCLSHRATKMGHTRGLASCLLMQYWITGVN